ncbi:MAG: hybrid sensor histidine kinase/response regulator [Gammaproteobacteria bacterium]|nr:hybrid sensor histidine kinase/response regulator [Gammaproteobacteria bacterium]
MVSGLLLTVLSIAYLGLLFAVAFYGERKSIYPGHSRLRPYIYSLALGVYCTTWTFLGAVGTAVRDGWSYVPIYLGPALVLLFGTPFLERLVAIARAHNTTSIADFVSSRFGKSPALAALVTIMAVTAAVPYLALQYKAVGTSIDVLTDTPGLRRAWFADTALWAAMLMALFAMLFGTRRLDATEHHEGVMLAIAFESVVKLLAFVAAGVYAVMHLGGAPALAHTRLGDLGTVFNANFVASTLVAAAAIVCLPRQFLVGIVECADPSDVRKARWLFSAYLGVFTLFVVPVVLAGLGAGLGERHHPDSFVLSLPLETGATPLAVLVFLGGLSAATAMVIVSSIALATMITNDLIMPALWRSRWLGLSEGADVGRLVLWLRRVTIVLLALLAYAYHHNTATPASLASIGLLAFAAVAQFAPALVTGLYWRGATREGVFWGLVAGFLVWIYTLLLPNFVAGGVIGWPLFDQGPWGISWLRPQTLFGIEFMSPVMRGATIALAANVLVLFAVSRLRGVSFRDRMAATSFLRGGVPVAGVAAAGGARGGDLLAVTERILGTETASRALAEYHRELGRPVPRLGEAADRGLLQYMERVLAGAIGASSARLMFTHALAGRGIAPEDVAEMLDETSQELRFSRQLLQATMENVSQGIAVADAEARIVAWNRRYIEMFDYPEGLVYVGRPVADLIRWNAEHGAFGPADTQQQIAKRIAHMKAGTSYVIQRTRPDGRVFEIRGQPLPDGGYVTTYTDITEFKRTEQALLEAKLTLEQRVEERTSALKAALAAQEVAKREAEEANATKTRFVAAASHDLLQPLNAARLFASTLGERSADRGIVEIAERIDSSMRAAEEVLDDMLDMARLESGTMRTEITDFPVSEAFEHLERQFATLAERRGLRLRFTRPTCRVRSDRVLLRRVLQNLVSNALRYTQRGGVLVSCRRRGRMVELQVWDTGPGIPEQHQRAIFDEFRRLDRPSPWGEQGLGLGLSICHRIGLLLGLQLGVRSEVGRGSVFSVRVPLSSATTSIAASPAPEVRAATPASLVGLVALCIDNEPEILDGMKALMSRWGVRVLTAVNSAEARRQAEQEPPDVILADYRLGDGELDGLDLLQAIRRGGVEPIPGALVTADHSPAVAERARALGYPVLRKPVKPAALRALLGALASQRQAGGSAVAAV